MWISIMGAMISVIATQQVVQHLIPYKELINFKKCFPASNFDI